MCLSQYDERAWRLAEKLIERGWDRTAAYGYAAAWKRRLMWNDWSSKRQPKGSPLP